MKKQLLVGLSAFASIAVVAQNSYRVVSNPLPKKVQTNKNIISEATPSNANGSIYSAANKIAGAPYKRIASSPNALGLIVSESRVLQYNKDINAVGLTYRQANTWAGIPNWNSGTISFAWTSNNGTSWDSTVLAASNAKLHRYPAGVMYNPAGNTTPSNAYAVFSGPWHPGASWQGVYFGSKQLTAPGTNTNTNVIYSDNLALTTGQIKQDFSRVDPQATADGKVRILGMLYGDANGTTVATQKWRGAAINTGTFSAGNFTWAVDSLKPAFKTNTAGDMQGFTGTANMAWNEAGTIGYVVFYGVDANAVAGTSQNSFQPYVYKTTNSGATWSRYNALYDFTTIATINDRLFPIAGSSTFAKPFLSPSEGGSATVDINGDLHIFTSLSSAFSDNIDSLGFTFSPNHNQVWNYILDLKTTSTGWTAIMIDSLQCEGPTAAQSNWTGATNISYDARCQVSRTKDGRKLFFSWADTDSNLVAGTAPHISLNPDVYMMGYDVASNKLTCKKNMTAGKAGVEALAYFFYATPVVAEPTSSSFLIPTTFVRSSTAGSTVGDNPVDVIYLDDNMFSSGDFTVTPNAIGCTTSGVGVKELSNSVSNISFYPNPTSANGTVEVVLTENVKMEVVVLNSVGQAISSTVVNANAGSNKVNINTANLSSGLYFYQVRIANNKSITQKFVVEK